MRWTFFALGSGVLVCAHVLAGCGSDELKGGAGGESSAQGGSTASSGGRINGDAGSDANEGGANATSGGRDVGSGGKAGLGGGVGIAGAIGDAGAMGASGGSGGSAGSGGKAGLGGATANGGVGGAIACRGAGDCPNPAQTVCSQASGTCVPGECNGASATECGVGRECVLQSTNASVGACYESCLPYKMACTDPSKDCVPIFFDDSSGVCLKRGSTAIGSPCEGGQLETGCVAGALCINEAGSPICRKQCEYFATAPACPVGNRCVMGDICTPGAFDPAQVGSLCGASTPAGTDCGDDGVALRGVCGNRGAGTSCFQVCRIGTQECGASATCTAVFSSIPELGVCFDEGACSSGGATTASCDACVDAAVAPDGCCDVQLARCDSDAQCSSLLDCINACTDAACDSACQTQYPNGVTPLNALLGCVYGTPSGSFLGACGSICQ
ncbi:MAG: hypothetical protein ACOY0T_27680 [Myxococcota bacterium]